MIALARVIASAAIGITVVTFGFPAVAQSTPQAPAATSDGFYAQGLRHLNRGALTDAEVAFKSALRVDPKAMGPLLGMADIALRKRDFAAAEKWVGEALAAHGHRAEALIGAARLHQAKGEHDEAIALLERAAVADSNSLAARLDLADIFLAIKRQPAKAEELFRQAVAIDPRNAPAHHGLAVALVQTQKFREAQGEVAEAIRLAPRNAVYRGTLSRIDLALKRPDEALKSAEMAINLDPNFAPAYVAKGNALLAKMDPERALQAFEAALRISPNLNEALYSSGMIHQIARRWPEAEAAYRHALAVQPDQPAVLNNLAWILADQRRDLDVALAGAKRAAQLEPGFGPYFDTLGWVYRARGDLRSAAAALEKATTLPPPNPETYVRLALVYSEGGDKMLALAALDKALALKPDMKEAQEAKERLQAN